MTDVLDWSHAVADVAKGGLQRVHTATERECVAIADLLGLLSLSDLTTSYRIDALAGGGYRLHGTLECLVEQACVVSLEPVPAHLNETFDVEFWPQLKREAQDQELTVLDAPEEEPLNNGAIAVGRVIFETISAGLDPYPRKTDAEFSWQDTAAQNPEKLSPFAALSRFKDKI